MKLIINFIIILFITNIAIAGCGSCQGDTKTARRVSKDAITTINSLITSVPKNGQVEGLIITSCGICNLDVKKGGCSLSVKIGDKVYQVEGTSIHDHGDAHGSEGFCSAIRVARAKGIIKKDVFHAESFALIGN